MHIACKYFKIVHIKGIEGPKQVASKHIFRFILLSDHLRHKQHEWTLVIWKHMFGISHIIFFQGTHRFFYQGARAPNGPRPPHYRGYMITLRHTTLGNTPLNDWSARRRDLYLTTHNTHNRQTSTPPVGFEPAIPASMRPQTHALDRAATGMGTPISKIRILSKYQRPSANLGVVKFLALSCWNLLSL
jgi:hypothetical protein